MAKLSEVDRIDDFVITVLFISVEVLGLSSMAWNSQLPGLDAAAGGAAGGAAESETAGAEAGAAEGAEAAEVAETADTKLTRVVEEERVVGSGILNQPVHGAEDVLLGRLAHGVLLVVGEDDHVLSLVAEVFDEIGRHVPNIVYAASKLASLAEVVDADEKSFSSTGSL